MQSETALFSSFVCIFQSVLVPALLHWRE